MSTPNSTGTNSEAPTGGALALPDDRQQVVLHTAIELWASSSTGIETRRRQEQLKNKQKIVQSFCVAHRPLLSVFDCLRLFQGRLAN